MELQKLLFLTRNFFRIFPNKSDPLLIKTATLFKKKEIKEYLKISLIKLNSLHNKKKKKAI